jgi:hypothetical protein
LCYDVYLHCGENGGIMTEKTYEEKRRRAKLAYHQICLGLGLVERQYNIELIKFWDGMIEVDGIIFDLKDYVEEL